MINNSSDNMYTNMHHYNTNMGIPPLGIQENGQQPVLSQKPMSYNTLTHNTEHNYPRVNNAYGPSCEQIYTNQPACYVPRGSTAANVIPSLSNM